MGTYKPDRIPFLRDLIQLRRGSRSASVTSIVCVCSCLWTTLYNTGARISEAIGIKVADVVLEGSPSIHLHGKGRKDRLVPVWPATASQIRRWLARIDAAPGKPLFPAVSGGPLTRSAVTDRLKRATKTASRKCVGLAGRKIHRIRFDMRRPCIYCNPAWTLQ